MIILITPHKDHTCQLLDTFGLIQYRYSRSIEETYSEPCLVYKQNSHMIYIYRINIVWSNVIHIA